MKAFKDYEKVQAATDKVKIPAGGYEVKILQAVEKEYESKNGDKFKKLEISFDIISGEYKDYYKNDYNSQISEEKRWKGTLRQYVPKDDGSEKDEWTKSTFKATVNAVEDSNPGYHWDWDEKKLKGKVVGCLLRNEEWEMNGKSGWTARPFKFIDVQKIRDGKFTVPKDKPLENKSGANPFSERSLNVEFEEVSDADYPF